MKKTGTASERFSSRIGSPPKKFLVHLSHLIYLRESQRNKSEGVQLATLLTIKLPQILFLTIFYRVVEYLF